METLSVPPALLGPHAASDLAPVPAGWRVGPPDYVGIGSGKAGTTWWTSLLARHPQVVANRLDRKELHYFPHFGWSGPGAQDVALYRQTFARPAGAVCGEWSGNYLYYPLALEWLARAAPETRVLALLRNPVDRLPSLLNQYARGRARLVGATGDGARVLQTWSLFPEAAYQARVAEGLERALALFGRERVLVLQYERCAAAPAAELARTLRFLGVDAGALPTDLTRPVHRQPYVVERPNADERATLAAWFRDDVQRTLALCPELDRALWPDFA